MEIQMARGHKPPLENFNYKTKCNKKIEFTKMTRNDL